MHHALARQPGERPRREHHQLTQLAKGHGHDQEGKATDWHGYRHALQHATRHYPAAHRHIVEGKGERAEGSVKHTEQGTFPVEAIIVRLGYNVIGHGHFSAARPTRFPITTPPFVSRAASIRSCKPFRLNARVTNLR